MGVQPAPARAITAEQFNQLTYSQVKGSGLANRCPTVENAGSSITVKPNSRLRYVCFEPKSFAVETELEPGKKEFVATKLTTRQTYTLDFIEGKLEPNPITFTEQDGMDFQAVTVKLPNGEYVPFMFTVKDLIAKGEGSEFTPGFQWGGEYMVPSYRGGGFLDPKGRGMYTGYDQAVGLAAGGALQGDEQGLRHRQGRHRDGGEQGEPGSRRDRRRLRRQAAVGHGHGRQGAEDHPLEGHILRKGRLSCTCFGG